MSLVRNLWSRYWQDNRPGVYLLLLVVVPLMVFSNTLSNDYHLDSLPRVKNNTELNRVWPPWRFFTDRHTGSTVRHLARYRPMMPLSNALNIALSDFAGIDRRAGFHLGNITVHIVTVILLYGLLYELLVHYANLPLPRQRHQDIAFAAALLFAVHPISGVPVNYLAARDLLLMMMFLTASLLIYARMRRRGETVGGWCTVLVLLALAILSKQVAIMAFGVVFFFEFLLAGARFADWRPWARVAACGSVTAAYFVMRQLWIYPDVPGGYLRVPAGLDYPLTMLKAHLFYYARNIVWPFYMRPLGHIEIVKSFADSYAILGAVFIGSTLGLAWYCRTRRPLLAFSILTYWWLFSLTSSIFPFRQIVTDYRQYPSLAFFCLALCMTVFERRHSRLWAGAFVVCVIYVGGSAYAMNTVWRTQESFWKQSVRYGGSARGHLYYGRSIAHKAPALAERHYHEALRLAPRDVYIHISLGLLHIAQGRHAEGLSRMRQTVGWYIDPAFSHYWLALALRMGGRHDEALTAFQRAADLDTRNLAYQYEAARAMQVAGDTASSIPYLERLMKFDPEYRDAPFLLAFAYQRAGRRQSAIAEYRRFLRTHPSHGKSHYNLAIALREAGDCQGAMPHFRRALKTDTMITAILWYLSACSRELNAVRE